MSPTLSFPKTWGGLAARLESANLRIDVRETDIRLLCLEAEKMGIGTVVVSPVNVSYAVSVLKGSKVKVAAAVSYPIGGDPADHKIKEVAEAVADGAGVIYMLMAVGAFRDDWVKKQTLPEIRGMVRGAAGRPTRLITEVSVLTHDQKEKIVRLAAEEHVSALVANTGFGRSNLPPMTNKDIQDLVGFAGDALEIMVMDRVGTLKGIREYFGLGVSRICTEHARTIWQEMTEKTDPLAL